MLYNGEGAWLSHLKLDGELVWKVTDEIPKWKHNRDEEQLYDGMKILPSDMHNRKDI